MFCPVCRDEFRPGFTRCATCEVDLVASLHDAAPVKPKVVVPEVAAEAATANFCGFLTLEEAREARDRVRAAGMPVEILIRDAPRSTAREAGGEEYWLRVAPKDFRVVGGIVGFAPAPAETADDSFSCSACGATVRAADEVCPGCGLGFEG